MKTSVHLSVYLAEFFLRWEMFQVKIYNKSNHTFYVQSRVHEKRAVF